MSFEITECLSRNVTRIIIFVAVVLTASLFYAYNVKIYEIRNNDLSRADLPLNYLEVTEKENLKEDNLKEKENLKGEEDVKEKEKLKMEENVKEKENLTQKEDKVFKILQWTTSQSAPFDFMGKGNSAFLSNKCKFTNCYVTEDVDRVKHNEDQFDAIAFNGRQVMHLLPIQMPKRRSPHQKYIFGAMESSDNYPVCNPAFDGYFNWTWTYKLDSDFRWGYITIYDLAGNVVGPSVNMTWPELQPTSEDVKKKLSGKSKAAAWFVSNCVSKSKREQFVAEVQHELEEFGLGVDVYGSCGPLKCPRSQADACFYLLQRDYYFYFSLENSYSEDYVTEKLLTALNNYAVPVVFGLANYSR